MARLTTYDENGVAFIDVDCDPLSLDYADEMRKKQDEAVEKLAVYETALESCKLFELLCIPKQKIWFMDNNIITSAKIKEIELSLTDIGSAIEIHTKDRTFKSYQFNNQFFCSKEELIKYLLAEENINYVE